MLTVKPSIVGLRVINNGILCTITQEDGQTLLLRRRVRVDKKWVCSGQAFWVSRDKIFPAAPARPNYSFWLGREGL